ncbi:sulfite exporter TauE/SafE family protein [Halalkalicoccus sp. NIPERK01]|uniref:sulfite exporter TauE/SafE family protein n=1 Tax=Halalkalicoccus sp. NIPERK01 TaxID=3053469 RepID=UPI00256EA5F3|nr:sulfite exporter TauE/SafE family protein [Halalkalicoccus sp. NIPERK01]MDL5363056.1 sulfite exporter TauE/SafE family protein [Halalkalicoccus sp. NIPERK01]
MSPFEAGIPLIVLFVVFGLTVGILFGFFGMGGSFFVTPALLVLGHSAPTAVGTGLAFVFWTSLTATITHRGLEHIDYRLGFLLILGTTVGIEIGKRALLLLADVGLADLVVSLLYVVLLASIGVFVIRDGRHPAIEDESSIENPSSLSAHLERVTIPPTVTFHNDVTLSVWVVLPIALVVGSLSGFLGVGGGFLMVPALMYGLAMPGAVAVGTDIFQITISSAYGAFVYGQQGAIHFAMLVPLLVGSTVGTRIGSVLTDHLDDAELRTTFGAMLLIGSISVASKTISHTYDIELLHTLSLTLLLGGALLMSVIILYLGVQNMREERSILF